MNSISATDLVLIPELSHLKAIEMIDPKNADLILPYLKVLGCDADFPVQFVPCQHRNLQGKVVVSYLICWEVECNDAFLSSSFASREDRIIAAAYKDVGLAQDLAAQQTSSRDYGSSPSDGFPPELTNKDEDDILAQIKQLDEILLLVRGDPYKSDGSRKLFDEAHVTEIAPDKQRRKRVAK